MNTAKERKYISNRNRVIFTAVMVVLAILAATGIIVAYLKYSADYEKWFNNRDKVLKERSEAEYSKVVVPPVLQLQSKKYQTSSSSELSYTPKWEYRYGIKADKNTVYIEVKQAFLNACGPDTVAGDETNFSYLDANCNNRVGFNYRLVDEKNAMITVYPGLTP